MYFRCDHLHYFTKPIFASAPAIYIIDSSAEKIATFVTLMFEIPRLKGWKIWEERGMVLYWVRVTEWFLLEMWISEESVGEKGFSYCKCLSRLQMADRRKTGFCLAWEYEFAHVEYICYLPYELMEKRIGQISDHF
jgi:hypothetical protein